MLCRVPGRRRMKKPTTVASRGLLSKLISCSTRVHGVAANNDHQQSRLPNIRQHRRQPNRWHAEGQEPNLPQNLKHLALQPSIQRVARPDGLAASWTCYHQNTVSYSLL